MTNGFHRPAQKASRKRPSTAQSVKKLSKKKTAKASPNESRRD